MTPNNRGKLVALRPVETLSRWDPWAEMEQTQRLMDAMIGRFLGGQRFGNVANSAAYAEFAFAPDVYETPEMYVFQFAVPGFQPEDIHIEITGEQLTLSGERKPLFTQENATQLARGGWLGGEGKFQFAYRLPGEINTEQVQANYRNGVLELHLPKAQALLPKSVKVNVNAE
jgi:HSP20 family protein